MKMAEKRICGSLSCMPPSSAMTMGLGDKVGSVCVESDSGMLPGGGGGGGISQNQYSQDIDQMPENPPRKTGHRRVHSEIITLPDDLCFDSKLGIVPGMDGPLFSDETDEDLFSVYLDMDKINASSAASSSGQVSGSSQGVAGPALALSPAPQMGSWVGGLTDKPRIRHQHSQSMDGLSTLKHEMFMSGSEVSSSTSDSKKAVSAAKLAELALVDPKRAKRIWANRQSAARSKERKKRYIAELERKIQTLQTEATSLTAQLSLLQSDTNDLMVENKELKVRLQTMEQQVMLQDAINDTLKEEIQHLKVVIGHTMSNGGQLINFPYGANQFYPNNQTMHTFMAAQQFPHLNVRPHKQQHQFQPLQHRLIQHQWRDQHLQQLSQPQQELHRQPNDAV